MTQAKAASTGHRVWKILWRGAGVIVLASLIAWMTRGARRNTDQNGRPAGFGRGVAQGALMPLALPSLLLGNDVPIYAANNTGLEYKLGYTMGVNGCGALFFGICYWRLARWRKRVGETGK